MLFIVSSAGCVERFCVLKNGRIIGGGRPIEIQQKNCFPAVRFPLPILRERRVGIIAKRKMIATPKGCMVVSHESGKGDESMPIRFHKSFKIFPGVRVNLSKSGIGLSEGVGPVHVSEGPRGTRETVSVPGTGVSFYEQQTRKKKKGCLGIFALILILSPFLMALLGYAAFQLV
jgi:hypothetical protein